MRLPARPAHGLVLAAAAVAIVGLVPSTAREAVTARHAMAARDAVAAWHAAAGREAVAPRATPSSDPNRTALLTTIDALDNTSHQVDMQTAYSQIQASIDPRSRTGTLTDRQGASEFDEIVANHRVWVRVNIDPQTNAQLGIAPSTWMSLDMTKLPPPNELPIPVDGSDPVDMPGILAGVTAVYRTSSDLFTGTIDLRKITGHNRPNAGRVARAGVTATEAPFSAVIDDRGRLTDFSINADSFDPALNVHVWFHSYGVIMSLPVPSGSVPAPDAIYTILSG